MTVMSISLASCANHFNRIIEKCRTFGKISNKIGFYVDSSCALVMPIALAFTYALALEDSLFIAIGKFYSYSGHTNTPMLIVMIDANHRLAYPLAKRLEGIANDRMVRRGKNIYGF
jgi:hypothetical protein